MKSVFPSPDLLKGGCHGDFAGCWPKRSRYLKNNPFFNLKSLLEDRQENMKWFLRERINYNQFLAVSSKFTRGTWKKIVQFFQLQFISILAI